MTKTRIIKKVLEVKHMDRNNCKGSSLLELLIVISIIAIMISILVPSLFLVKESAKQLVGLSDFRQDKIISFIDSNFDLGDSTSFFEAESFGVEATPSLSPSFIPLPIVSPPVKEEIPVIPLPIVM